MSTKHHIINRKATEYLQNKPRGKRVFPYFDEQKYDAKNHLLAYLHLENKIFVDANLLKEGVAELDSANDFK